MSRIKFANGAVYDCTFLATNPNGSDGGGKAYIALADVSFAEAVAIFGDENCTCEIEYGDFRLVGYTELIDICKQPYGIQAALRGGHDERLS